MGKLAFVLATLIVSGICSATGQDKSATTLEQDRKKLEGVWRTDNWDKPGAKDWQLHAAVDLQGLKSPQVALTIDLKTEGARQMYTQPAEIREKDGNRWIAIDNAELVKVGAAHAAIYYRFDGESLMLRFWADQSKGEYKLQRVKKE